MTSGITGPVQRRGPHASRAIADAEIRDVLRLRFEVGLSEREIGRGLRLSNGSVNAYLPRVRVAGLAWPLPAGLDDDSLESLLFPPGPTREAVRARPRRTGYRRRGVAA
jgi:hypothetical protein